MLPGGLPGIGVGRESLGKEQPELQQDRHLNIYLKKPLRRPGSLRYSHVSTFLPPCTISGGLALLPLSPDMFSFFPFLVLSF